MYSPNLTKSGTVGFGEYILIKRRDTYGEIPGYPGTQELKRKAKGKEAGAAPKGERDKEHWVLLKGKDMEILPKGRGGAYMVSGLCGPCLYRGHHGAESRIQAPAPADFSPGMIRNYLEIMVNSAPAICAGLHQERHTKDKAEIFRLF